LKETKTARKGPVRAKKPEPPKKKVPLPRPPGQEKAIEEFAAAIKLFQKRELARARAAFQEVLANYPGETEIADRVRTYVQICDRTLHPSAPRLKDPDDFYHQGVVLMNQQNLEEASRMFERALSQDPGSEKCLYAQATVFALSGRRDEALEILRRAIAANHANRPRAANDSDFEPLRDDAEFQALVRTEQGRDD